MARDRLILWTYFIKFYGDKFNNFKREREKERNNTKYREGIQFPTQ